MKIHDQKNKVWQWYTTHKGTMLECAKATLIERANICRYIHDLQEEHKVTGIGVRRDFYTGERAVVYTAIEGGKI